MARSVALWSGLLVLLQGVPRPADSTSSALFDLERELLAAEVRQDSAYFRELELGGYRFVGWGGEELTKSDDLAAVAQPRPGRVVAFGVDDLIVQPYGRTALVWGRDTMVIANRQGGMRVSRSRFTHVFVRHAGKWRLAAAHASPIGKR